VQDAAQRLTSGLPVHIKLTSAQSARLVAILPKIKLGESLGKKLSSPWDGFDEGYF